VRAPADRAEPAAEGGGAAGLRAADAPHPARRGLSAVSACSGVERGVRGRAPAGGGVPARRGDSGPARRYDARAVSITFSRLARW
jgi:hypothetical protein